MEADEELILGHRSWKRSVDPIEKDGFREGFEKGRQETYQKGFDMGYAAGFQYAFVKGAALGKLKAENKPFQDMFDEVKRNCILCSTSEEDVEALTINEIMEKQKEAQK